MPVKCSHSESGRIGSFCTIWHHPFHKWGSGRVVFKDWESLHKAVEDYRSSPENYAELGDWFPDVDGADPFRDGKAWARIGTYIDSIYNALKQGASKEAVLETARQRFSERWGLQRTVEPEPQRAGGVC